MPSLTTNTRFRACGKCKAELGDDEAVRAAGRKLRQMDPTASTEQVLHFLRQCERERRLLGQCDACHEQRQRALHALRVRLDGIPRPASSVVAALAVLPKRAQPRRREQ